MPDPSFQRNPARDVEKYAIETVARWLGRRGTVVDTSTGHGPDFRVDYVDGRVAVGEVGWHEDPLIQEMWANVFKREEHQVIRLGRGVGQWAVGLTRGANIGTLYKQLPALVDSLVAGNRHQLEIHGDWPRTDAADAARRLGISYLSQVTDADPDVAIFFMPADGGAVPSDPNGIVDWVEEVLTDADYLDTTDKLRHLDADEHQVFLMTGSRTSYGVGELLGRLDSALPNRTPVLPDWISHVWVVPRFGPRLAGLWIAGSGWTTA